MGKERFARPRGKFNVPTLGDGEFRNLELEVSQQHERNNET
jgi:hypothetical protein